MIILGLVSNTIKIKWNPANKKYYESLGYIFTKCGDEFEVRIEHLTKGSGVKVEGFCDNCKKPLIWKYQDYNKCVKEDGRIYCNKCAKKLYGGENIRKAKLKNGKSFYVWCIENGRRDILKRWDYKLNGCSPKDVCYKSNNKYWFKCDRYIEHKSELKSIQDFTSGHEGSMDCKQCNSIGQYVIDNHGEEFLRKIWSEKNKISPFKVSVCTNKKVWWNCPEDKHESFRRNCDNSVACKFRCPKCVEEKNSLL